MTYKYFFIKKPFANLTVPQSIGTNLVPTLMDPGDDPASNRLFLLTTAAVLRGVDIHQDLLRYATSGAGNDHRLGGHEAPPAIFSVYLGDAVGTIVRQIAEGKPTALPPHPKVDLGVSYLPIRGQDNTDRNRTSPVAFTGNKFEVRCVGSSQQPAMSNLVLNTITAESYYYLADEIKKEKSAGKSLDAAVNAVLQRTFKQHLRIINDGDGYSHAWPDEAKGRGLLNLKTTPEVLERVLNDKNRDLFAKLGVWTVEEFEANVSIDTERYSSQIHLEAQSLRNLIDRYILPAGLEMYHKCSVNADAVPKARLDKIKSLTIAITEGSDNLAEKAKHLQSLGSGLTAAQFAVREVVPKMREVRGHADELESYVDYKLWPLPTYEDMLHERHDDNE